MKNNGLMIAIGLLLLSGCTTNDNSSSLVSNISNSANSSNSEISSKVFSDINQESTTASNDIDYSKFDKNLVGIWYVHSSWAGLLEINTQIIIKDTYEVQIYNMEFSFVGIYENFDGACLFENASGSIKFIASSDEEGVLDWGLFDSIGNQDIGVARVEEHISGIAYSYEGEEWPIEQIKDFMGTSLDLPIYEHGYYYLFTGLSQVYDDEKYCMIDLYEVSSTAREDYTKILEDNGYVFEKSNSNFYQGYDETKTYAIKLSQYEDNMCIFIYYYSTLY